MMNCKYCKWCGTINNLEWICNNSNSEKFNKELTVRLSRHTIKSGCSQYSELTEIEPMPENYIPPKTEFETVSTGGKQSIHESICKELNIIYGNKNADYGDSFAKLRKELDNPILVRVYDKFSRLKQLMGGAKQRVNNESIEDTLMDLANYCIMELVERRIDNDTK